MFVHEISDEVWDAIQDTLTEMVRERGSVFR